MNCLAAAALAPNIAQPPKLFNTVDAPAAMFARFNRSVGLIATFCMFVNTSPPCDAPKVAPTNAFVIAGFNPCAAPRTFAA